MVIRDIDPVQLDLLVKEKGYAVNALNAAAASVILCQVVKKNPVRNPRMCIEARLLEVDRSTDDDIAQATLSDEGIELIIDKLQLADWSRIHKGTRLGIVGYQFQGQEGCRRIIVDLASDDSCLYVVKSAAGLTGKKEKYNYRTFDQLKALLEEGGPQRIPSVEVYTFCFVESWSKSGSNSTMEYRVFDLADNGSQSHGRVVLGSNGHQTLEPLRKNDILRLHRVGVELDRADNGRLLFDGEFGVRGCAAALFHVSMGTSKEPYAKSSVNCKVDMKSDEILEKMRSRFYKFSQRQSNINAGGNARNSVCGVISGRPGYKNYKKISDLTGECYCDVVGQVIGVAKILAVDARVIPRVMVRIWDGTKRKLNTVTSTAFPDSATGRQVPENAPYTLQWKLSDKVLKEGYSIDVPVYDQGMAKAETFARALGSFIHFSNVHVYRQRGFPDYWPTAGRGAQVFPVPDNDPAARNCQERFQWLFRQWTDYDGDPGFVDKWDTLDSDQENRADRQLANTDRQQLVNTDRQQLANADRQQLANTDREQLANADRQAASGMVGIAGPSSANVGVLKQKPRENKREDVSSSVGSFKTARHFEAEQGEAKRPDSSSGESDDLSLSTILADSQTDDHFVNSQEPVQRRSSVGSPGADVETPSPAQQEAPQSTSPSTLVTCNSSFWPHIEQSPGVAQNSAAVPQEKRGGATPERSAVKRRGAELSSDTGVTANKRGPCTSREALQRSDIPVNSPQKPPGRRRTVGAFSANTYKDLDPETLLETRKFKILACSKPDLSEVTAQRVTEILNLCCAKCWQTYWLHDVLLYFKRWKKFVCKCGATIDPHHVTPHLVLRAVDENGNEFILDVRGEQVMNILKISIQDLVDLVFNEKGKDLTQIGERIKVLSGEWLEVEGFNRGNLFQVDRLLSVV